MPRLHGRKRAAAYYLSRREISGKYCCPKKVLFIREISITYKNSKNSFSGHLKEDIAAALDR